MNITDLPADWAPIQLIRTDYVPAQVLGNFHDEAIARQSLASSRIHNPHATYDLMRDGVSIEKPKARHPKLQLLRRAA